MLTRSTNHSAVANAARNMEPVTPKLISEEACQHLESTWRAGGMAAHGGGPVLSRHPAARPGGEVTYRVNLTTTTNLTILAAELLPQLSLRKLCHAQQTTNDLQFDVPRPSTVVDSVIDQCTSNGC